MTNHFPLMADLVFYRQREAVTETSNIEHLEEADAQEIEGYEDEQENNDVREDEQKDDRYEDEDEDEEY